MRGDVSVPIDGGEVWRTGTVTETGGLWDELIGNRVWSLARQKLIVNLYKCALNLGRCVDIYSIFKISLQSCHISQSPSALGLMPTN